MMQESCMPRAMVLSVFLVLLFVKGSSSLCNFGYDWPAYGGRCYFVSDENDLRTFSEAQERCEQLGTTLASMNSPEESNYVSQNLIECLRAGNCDYDAPEHTYWIGLRKDSPARDTIASTAERRAGWYWLDGSQLSWRNWYDDEPDSGTGYARMYHNGEWADKEPERLYRYICETGDTGSGRTTTKPPPTISRTRPPTTTTTPVATTDPGEQLCMGEWKSANCERDESVECDYKVTWFLNGTTDVISFNVSAKQSQDRWTAVGFSDDRQMTRSDVVYGFQDESGIAYVLDAWTAATFYRSPIVDDVQDLTNTSVIYEDGILEMSFDRPRDTGDPDDKQFTDCLYFLLPIGGGNYNKDYGVIFKHKVTPLISTEKICIEPCEE